MTTPISHLVISAMSHASPCPRSTIARCSARPSWVSILSSTRSQARNRSEAYTSRTPTYSPTVLSGLTKDEAIVGMTQWGDVSGLASWLILFAHTLRLLLRTQTAHVFKAVTRGSRQVRLDPQDGYRQNWGATLLLRGEIIHGGAWVMTSGATLSSYWWQTTVHLQV